MFESVRLTQSWCLADDMQRNSSEQQQVAGQGVEPEGSLARRRSKGMSGLQAISSDLLLAGKQNSMWKQVGSRGLQFTPSDLLLAATHHITAISGQDG
jgi:hypothetical protein